MNKEKHKIGLVLSGGGTRGFAHLGAYKALMEKGIFPDIISGTSAGAIIGAFISNGNSIEEIYKILESGDFFSFTSFSFKKSGLVELEGLKKELEKKILVDNLEDLRLPLIVSSTNINKGKIEYHSKGNIIQRVLASSSIPVLFTPKKINGEYHVDGGIFDNLPVLPIREMCEYIVGINISPIREEQNIDSMLEISARTFHLSTHSNMLISKKMCDVLIEPLDLCDYSIIDTKHSKKIFQIGYEAVKNTDFNSIINYGL